MSIAELIMQGTKRSSESTAWVGDSLAKLGQNVGAALAQREQQKQAQEMLPFLQQSMQESMTLAGSGKTGEAYAKLMPFLTDPSVINNPNLLPAVNAALKLNELETNNFFKKEQLRVREDMYNARYGGGGGEPQQSGAEQAYNFMTGNVGTTETTPVGSNVTSNAKTPLTPTDRAAIEQAAKNIVNLEPLPDEVPQQPTGLPAMETKPFTMESDAATFAQLGGTPYQQASASNLRTFEVLPPDQKSQIVNQSVSFDPGAEKYEYKNIDLGEWGINIGRFGIPKVGQEIIIKKSARGSTDKPGMDVTFTEERIKVGEQQYKDANDFIKELITANSDLSRERPSKDLPTFKEIFKQNGGILNATIAPLEQAGMDSNMKFELIPKSGAAAIPITETQAKQIKQIQGASEIATGTGLNLSPSKKMETVEAPAPVEDALSVSREVFGVTKKTTATKTQPAPEKLSAENPFAQAVSEKKTQETAIAKQSIETQKTKIQDSISELEDKLKILTAVGQRNPEILPDYLRRKMGAYMNATPSRNAKDFEDTKKEIEKLRSKLKSL